ncbi:MAG: LysE family translocator [Paracoccaceae bacterium]
MTVTLAQLSFYAGGLLLLFLTPGPVWVAMVARAVSGGFHAAWPVAAGVVVGDVLWPFLAILGVTWILEVYGGFLEALKWVAAATFVAMGIAIWRHADADLTADGRLTRPGLWAGFAAGLAVILGNPKAILFYMGVLPGFFDLTALTWADMAAIAALSAAVPLLGNLVLAAAVGRARTLLSDPGRVARLNRASAVALIAVGAVIPFT